MIPARFDERYDPQGDGREGDRRDAAREPPISCAGRGEDERWARELVARYEAKRR